ncbi:MAG TPA: DUF58 domain-containing protein [Nocardioides sp.]|nr:DUF58 domain-containing protein [Nocardioides sp.]
MAWRATHAQVRATVAGAAIALAGVASGRPELVVIAAPLVVVAVAAGSARPRHDPAVEATTGAATVHEDEPLAWTATVGQLPSGALVTGVHPPQRFLEVEPPDGRMIGAYADGQAVLELGLTAHRWGRRTLGDPVVTAHDRWLAWRAEPVTVPGLRLVVLPRPQRATGRAPAPHPQGHVGMERASRVGDGSELAKVRPFVPGDRLRRVNWRVSARSGQLHVTATHADADARVVLMVDALNDIGESHGDTGTPSSMDITVRAAATLAGHYLRRGDRVGLRVFGAWQLTRVPARAGQVQLRRILDALALVEPGTARGTSASAAQHGLGAGALVMLLSPLVEPVATQQVARLHRAGHDVVVVDTLPTDLPTAGTDPAALALRIRLIERGVELDRLRSLGIPVTAWAGPHSLDQVLLELAHRSRAPRLVVP